MSGVVQGAYGVRLSGLEGTEWLGVTAAAHWPELICTIDEDPDAPELSVDMRAFELRIRADISYSDLVHPLLGRVAGHLALARGADGMHAGAMVGQSGAWAVIGPKGAGKSTLLAEIARAGTAIVTDDVLVLDNGVALAGPRCIDLRPDARQSGRGVAVRPLDPRNRVPLPPTAAEHALVGLVHLDWSSAGTRLELMNHRDSIRRLLTLRDEKGYPRDPDTLFDLAELPNLILSRPRSQAGLKASVAATRALLSEPTVSLQAVGTLARSR